MKISIEYVNPTPAHCDVRLFVNGGLAGTLRLRQEEIVSFQQILQFGCSGGMDEFRGSGNPNPPEKERQG